MAKDESITCEAPLSIMDAQAFAHRNRERPRAIYWGPDIVLVWLVAAALPRFSEPSTVGYDVSAA